MNKKKKPNPAGKKKPVSAGKKKPATAGKKKPVTAEKKKPSPAGKKKPVTAGKKKSAADRKIAKPAAAEKRVQTRASAPKAPVGVWESLRRAAIVAAALLAVFGVVLSVISVHNEKLQSKGVQYYAGLLQEECVQPIELTDEQVRQSVRNTMRHGQTHAFSYYCSRTLNLDADNLTGYILFGNPADNDCDLVLSIYDSEDNLIYRTGGLTPGKCITLIRPSVDEWERGTYACRAIVTAYRGQGLDYKCIGAQYSRLTVNVGVTS